MSRFNAQPATTHPDRAGTQDTSALQNPHGRPKYRGTAMALV